jgi:hypothetical protein
MRAVNSQIKRVSHQISISAVARMILQRKQKLKLVFNNSMGLLPSRLISILGGRRKMNRHRLGEQVMRISRVMRGNLQDGL